MFKILINESNGKITELFDDDKRSISEYTKELATLMDLNSISILNTTSGDLICRPQNIQSIFIEEQENNLSEPIPIPKGPLIDSNDKS